MESPGLYKAGFDTEFRDAKTGYDKSVITVSTLLDLNSGSKSRQVRDKNIQKRSRSERGFAH